jgi:AcrR family transcriptional regulator
MEPTDPRAVRSREAMLAAATALLAEDGLEAVTHQTVAARAGVGRATVYRHWPQLLDLRLAGLSVTERALPSPPADLRAASGGDPRAELAYQLRGIAARFTEPVGAVVAAIISGAEHDEGMRRLRQRTTTLLVDALRDGVAAALERGQLGPDATAETFAMFTLGSLFYKRFLVGSTIDDHTTDTVVDSAIRALAPADPVCGFESKTFVQ